MTPKKKIHPIRPTKFHSLLRKLMSALCFSIALASDAGEWTLENAKTAGDDAPLCARLLKHVRAVPEACWVDAVETFPDFTSMPWTNLDTAKYLQLALKLSSYSNTMPSRYFSAAEVLSTETSIARQRYVQSILTKPDGLRVWRGDFITRFDTTGYGPIVKAPSVVVLLTTHIPVQSPSCASTTSTSANGYEKRTFVVTPDLAGPDPQVKDDVKVILNESTPVLYKGSLRLIHRYGVRKISEPTGFIESCKYSYNEDAG